jgi:hypothetical protein
MNPLVNEVLLPSVDAAAGSRSTLSAWAAEVLPAGWMRSVKR